MPRKGGQTRSSPSQGSRSSTGTRTISSSGGKNGSPSIPYYPSPNYTTSYTNNLSPARSPW